MTTNAPSLPALFAEKTTSMATYKIATPALLRGGLALLGVLLLVFGAGLGLMIHETKNGVQTITRDTAPSVIAAQQIRASLAALDASAVNAALLRGPAAQQAWRDFEAQQRVLSDYLVTAAQNITFGDAERGPIVEIAASLQRYADLIGQARAIHGDPSMQTPPEATLALLRHAGTLISDQLAPAAEALNGVNDKALEKSWAARKMAGLRNPPLLVLAAMAPLAVLLALQIVLARRMRRSLNPGMAAASLVLVAGVLMLGTGLLASADHLRIAKEDAFDSVRALWKARATLYAANADESYFLLDPARKSDYGASFSARIGQIAGGGFLDPQVRAALVNRAILYRARGCRFDDPGARIQNAGYIGDEVNNVTFEHECEEAVNLFPLLKNYVDIDQKIRALDAAGNRAAALALDLGENPGESNYAFAKVNQELGLLIDINQMAFEDNAARAAGDLVKAPYILGVLVALVWLLAFIGLRPRLAEYRG
ncbi:hypothetical protein [Rhodoblastus sp.]|uniref:hypothetical protein n=1 Tax=Rhodoblastus sp. TaxID=1962975 RepID=UPI003F95A21A